MSVACKVFPKRDVQKKSSFKKSSLKVKGHPRFLGVLALFLIEEVAQTRKPTTF
jgi:hypothetical protein